MRATEFEFRHRFWVIAAIYGAGFSMTGLDRKVAALAIAERLAGRPLHLHSPADIHRVQAVLGFAVVLAILAAGIRTWGAAYLRSEVVHDPTLHAEGLVADGPYRYVRNPLYVGGILLAAAFGLLASRVGFFVIVIGITLFYYRLTCREEAALLSTQGEPYRRFLAAVPRLVPSLTPRLPPGAMKPRWGQAFLGETFVWLFALSILIFAITVRPVDLNIALAASFAGYVIAMSVVRKRRRQRRESPEARMQSKSENEHGPA